MKNKAHAAWLGRLKVAERNLKEARRLGAHRTAIDYWTGAVKHAKHMARVFGALGNLSATKKAKKYAKRKKSYGR